MLSSRTFCGDGDILYNAAYYSSHMCLVAIEHLRCSYGDWGIESLIYLILINKNWYSNALLVVSILDNSDWEPKQKSFTSI